jgi:type III pantothenate kinase
LSKDKNYLALMIGNSRFHWGYFRGSILDQTWHTPPLQSLQELETVFSSQIPFLAVQKLPLFVASVVPSPTDWLEKMLKIIVIKHQDIPIKKTYSTIGIDRILALWGAGIVYGFPCLVIDGGTALTFTGANLKAELVGGAILPGVNLQLQSLALHTAALPSTNIPDNLPPRWANNTSDAIKSGVIYTIMAGIKNFIEHWQNQFSSSKIILTGGDGMILKHYLDYTFPETGNRIMLDNDLIFWGIKAVIGKKHLLEIKSD